MILALYLSSPCWVRVKSDVAQNEFCVMHSEVIEFLLCFWDFLSFLLENFLKLN